MNALTISENEQYFPPCTKDTQILVNLVFSFENKYREHMNTEIV
jgi:hypothetical protein